MVGFAILRLKSLAHNIQLEFYRYDKVFTSRSQVKTEQNKDFNLLTSFAMSLFKESKILTMKLSCIESMNVCQQKNIIRIFFFKFSYVTPPALSLCWRREFCYSCSWESACLLSSSEEVTASWNVVVFGSSNAAQEVPAGVSNSAGGEVSAGGQ